MQNSYKQHFKKIKQNKTTGSPAKKVKIKPQQGNKISTEEQIRQTFLKNAQFARKQKRKQQSIPWKLISGLFLFTLMAGYGAYNPAAVDQLISKVEITFIGSTYAQSEKNQAKNTLTKVNSQAKTSPTVDKTNSAQVGGDNTWTLKELSYFSKLEERKNELDSREQELAKLEEELHKQKKEIEGRIVELQKIRNQISTILKDKVAVDQQKVNKLVDVYSNMKPQNAAKIFGDIDENLAIEILAKMKKKNAAEILNLLDAKKAQTLSEKFAGYQRR